MFGTLVDWRSGVAREAERLFPGLDGGAFADAWRERYAPSMQTVRSGARGFVDLDGLQAESLPEVLAGFGIGNVPEPIRRGLIYARHRLDAWPEVPGALSRLRERHVLAPLSNGHVRLMVDLARRNGFVLDAVLGAGYSRDYKPKPALYPDAVAAFGFEPAERRCWSPPTRTISRLPRATGSPPLTSSRGPASTARMAARRRLPYR